MTFKEPKPLESKLLEEINSPLHPPFRSSKKRPANNEVSLASGLTLIRNFPIDLDSLDTAFADFSNFLRSMFIPPGTGAILNFIYEPDLDHEEHCVEITSGHIHIHVNDPEGIRRALVWIEDEMLSRNGPFLPIGRFSRKPVIKTRLSRCFFGPINRPPFNRDELADDVDYYPEGYLNRLAHEGVNALWLTIKFAETVPSKIIKEHGRQAKSRLEKLRWTVLKCARYGIKVFVFCIEPACHPENSHLFIRHAELKGHTQDGYSAFCTSSKLGQAYLEEAARTLFKSVPGLGGMIVIPVGERFSHCYSLYLPESGRSNRPCNCPRCKTRSPYDVLSDTLAALDRGMKTSAPEAELIAWPYGQMFLWGPKATIEAASHMPPNVILQHNFETGGINHQAGKDRPLWDYWLSWAGPSKVFAEASSRARKQGTRVSAKLQVGCSHEIATVPFVPVPGLLYEKYRAMRTLEVSSAMQSWYFGNYPSIMTKAAGELSFDPFPRTETEFLHRLARRNWGSKAGMVAKAWSLFRQAYEFYPASHFFGYYGPMQDGVTWPLYLIPRNAPLAPTWVKGYAPSGDHLADCLSSFFTLEEVISLCRKMVSLWRRGLAILENAHQSREENDVCRREVIVARSISLQFETGLEILRFYSLREKLARARHSSARPILQKIERLLTEDIERRLEVMTLCQEDSRIGFHSEAEDYKVTPTLIRRGIRELKKTLKNEIPRVRKALRRKENIFGQYLGIDPKIEFLEISPALFLQGRAQFCGPQIELKHLLEQGTDPRNSYGGKWIRAHSRQLPVTASFQISHDQHALHILIEITGRDKASLKWRADQWTPTAITDLKPSPLRPRIQFISNPTGYRQVFIDDGILAQPPAIRSDWTALENGWLNYISLPWKELELQNAKNRFRLNVRVDFQFLETKTHYELSWTKRKPLKARLAWGDANPNTDYAWAICKS